MNWQRFNEKPVPTLAVQFTGDNHEDICALFPDAWMHLPRSEYWLRFTTGGKEYRVHNRGWLVYPPDRELIVVEGSTFEYRYEALP